MHSHRVPVCLGAFMWMTGALVGCAPEGLGEEGADAPRAAQVASSGRVAPQADCDDKFDSSYAAIQALVFERHGCTAAACHGQAKVGGLDLRADVSWENLVDAPSVNSKSARVQPGTTSESFLFDKLKAATHPGSVQIAGSPMPVGAPPLTATELEAVALWIIKGAPKVGVVSDETKNVDVGKLLNACLPPPKPVKIKPLEPPAKDEGIQLVMPTFLLKGNSEVENCTPFAYDLTDRVPAEFKDEARNVIYVNSSRVRQDPQSHHLSVWDPKQDPRKLPSTASGWTCRAGALAGKACDPTKGSQDCGEGGVCAGKTVAGTFCDMNAGQSPSAGLDPAALADPRKLIEALTDPKVIKAATDALAGVLSGRAGGGFLPSQLTSTQSPQEYIPPIDGVYWEIPLRGVMSFNSHAFNLTDGDTELEARVNFYFAKKREREMVHNAEVRSLYIAAGQPPFTRKSYCTKMVVPQHYSLAVVLGHTHRRGEHFWVHDPAGKKIYENFVYNDPVTKRFDPWITFDGADAASRTLEYCATYNNGLTRDDKPDLNLVTRASRMPDRTSCKPVACVAGKVTAACTSDRDCDSAPGANDGDCDACAITAGATTENEMFALSPWFVLPAKSGGQ